ncbi:MAG: SCO family protein [Elusimicrobia bacterium]|jgi:protein SCO1/2|nr:SCO family protein [Elusimicrobiota bacterium]
MAFRVPPPEFFFRQFCLWLTLVLMGLIGSSWYLDREKSKTSDSPKGAPVPVFHLLESTGKSFSSVQLTGRVWVANFIFTRCQGPCPLLSQQMARLQKTFADAEDFRLVSFSVDPAFDTPSVLRSYGARFGADPKRWFFLWGEPPTMHEVVVNGFRIAVDGSSPPHPANQLIHSVRLVLVDRDGIQRGSYDGTNDEEVERLERDLRALL